MVEVTIARVDHSGRMRQGHRNFSWLNTGQQSFFHRAAAAVGGGGLNQANGGLRRHCPAISVPGGHFSYCHTQCYFRRLFNDRQASFFGYLSRLDDRKASGFKIHGCAKRYRTTLSGRPGYIDLRWRNTYTRLLRRGSPNRDLQDLRHRRSVLPAPSCSAMARSTWRYGPRSVLSIKGAGIKSILRLVLGPRYLVSTCAVFRVAVRMEDGQTLAHPAANPKHGQRDELKDCRCRQRHSILGLRATAVKRRPGRGRVIVLRFTPHLVAPVALPIASS